MKLTWSHTVIYVRDQKKMLAFYTQVLGFKITDRGPLAEDAPEIVFLSNDPNEHHQIAMVQTRQDELPSNSVNHFAFRTEQFQHVTALNRTLADIDGIKVSPLSHGNTLSIYFNDPEQNGLEVFWDTPWHVPQPQGKTWDPSMSQDAAVAWVKENFEQVEGFVPRAEYFQGGIAR